MSPKELLYIEDALNHVQFLKTQCTECANQLKDQNLKNFVNEIVQQNSQLFNQLYQTL